MPKIPFESVFLFWNVRKCCYVCRRVAKKKMTQFLMDGKVSLAGCCWPLTKPANIRCSVIIINAKTRRSLGQINQT